MARAQTIGPLAPAFLFPGVKAVGGNEAAPPAHGVAEGWLVVHGLAARIDEQAEILRVLDPRRDQAPTHQRELPFSLDLANDGHRLRRRDIVARREIRLLRIAEQAPDRFRRGNDHVASTHLRPVSTAASTHHSAQIWRQTTSPKVSSHLMLLEH